MTVFNVFRLAFTIVAFMVLAACSRSDEQNLQAAKTHLANRDLPAAIIELKNALQANPDLPEARLLLGQALLDRGDPIGAAVELEKARSLKVTDDEVLPSLAQALLQSGETRKVIELDRISVLTAPKSIASLKTSIALAHSAEGNKDNADAAINAALQAKPDHAPALLLRARSLAATRDLEGAFAVVDNILRADAGNPDALALRGDLLRFARNDLAGAKDAYRKALAARADHLGAHAALLSLLLAENDIHGARKQFDALNKVRPNELQTAYFQARVAVQGGDVKTASSVVQQLLKRLPEAPQVLELASVVYWQQGELAQAEQHASKLVQVAPSATPARTMLAQIQLRLGEPASALATLEPLLEGPSPSVRVLSLAGSAKMLAGDVKGAGDYFARAAKLDPADARSRTALAVTRLARGDMGGVDDLEAVASADAGTQADMALISISVRRSDFATALKAVERLDKKQPGKAQTPYLRGVVLEARGDMVGARANYEKALTADPDFFVATTGLASLDIREGKPDSARDRIDSLLRKNPNDARAMVVLARLDERAGKPKEHVAAIYARAVAAKPGDPQLRRHQIQYLLKKQDFKAALAAAQEASSALPNDAAVLAMLASAQLAAGEANQAISSFRRLAAVRPRSPEPLIGLASAQLAMNVGVEAAETMKQALTLAPDSPVVFQKAIQVDLLNGQPDAALAKARQLQSRQPKSGQGFTFEGDIEASRQNWPASAAAYRAALQREGSSGSAQRLYAALVNAGDRAKAGSFAAEWRERHPRDALFMFFAAGEAIRARDFASAETYLAQVLQVTPSNAAALNNMAWVLATQKKPGALPYAEKANQLSPRQPAFMDTLAMVQQSQGNLAAALSTQKEAVALAPGAHALRLRLARLFLSAGDRAAAQRELEVLTKLGDAFPQQAEVRELLKRL